MNLNLHTQPNTQPFDTRLSDGGIWYQLRAERERICQALLDAARVSQPADAPKVSQNSADTIRLQARLGLIDDALDRLMAGSYGDCVVCGRWIEDTKLHDDPALPFCCACQRHSSIPAPFLSYYPHPLGELSPAVRGLLRN